MISFSEFLTEKASFDIALQQHERLNPKLWKKETLDPEVKVALLRIAHDWAEFSKIPMKAIKDIIIMGGNCQFNYTDKSDIDLHLVVDMKSIFPDDCSEILQDWLYDKKILWAKYHPNIRIKGYPVELYAQDENAKPKKFQGIYSILSNKWLNKPEKQNTDEIFSDENLIDKIKHYMKFIDSLTNDSTYSTKEKITQIKDLKKKFYDMRSAGLLKAGEYSHENLIYKSLRNLGKIDQMNDYLSRAEDQHYSISEMKNI